VFHNFHDEVDVYRTHIWKCDGPCQHRPPFFGLVRRAMNRAPSVNDPWWSSHAASCGGTYKKIAGPPPAEAKRKRAKDEPEAKPTEAPAKGRKINEMFQPISRPSREPNVETRDSLKTRGQSGSAIVVDDVFEAQQEEVGTIKRSKPVAEVASVVVLDDDDDDRDEEASDCKKKSDERGVCGSEDIEHAIACPICSELVSFKHFSAHMDICFPPD
jgi:hypothetical protein